MSFAHIEYKTSFHAGIFEKAINRHGQYVRWYSSLPCPCMDELSRPNPNHRECFGRGLLYSPITEKRILEEAFSYGGREIKSLSKIKRLLSVTTTMGQPLDVTSYQDKTIVMKDILNRGSYYMLDYVVDLVEEYEGPATYAGLGIIEVPLTPSVVAEGTFIGTILEITELINVTQDIPIAVQSFWENRIYTRTAINNGDQITIKCKMLQPTKMLITSVKGTEPGSPMYSKDANKMAAWQNFDAICTYPGYMMLGQNDLITLLRAEQKMSAVGTLTPGETFYKVPFFHLRNLVSIRDSIGPIDNVSIARQSDLVFGGRKPNGRFSFSFTYLPTFIVSGESSVLRYGENKEFPKRIGLQRYEATTRSEMKPTSIMSTFATGDT